MKKLLIAIAFLLLLAGVVFGLAAAKLNSYLQRNRDWIAATVSGRLGRKVAFEEIGLSIRGGLGARLKGVRVGDDPSYSEGDFLRAAEARLKVRLLPALRGRFEVARVSLREPSVTIIRDRAGFNFGSVGGLGGGTEARAAARPPGGAQAGRERAAPAFALSMVDIKGATVRYLDRRQTPPMEILVEDLNLTASDLGLAAPTRVKGEAAVLGSEERNLQVGGEVGPIGARGFRGTPFDVSLDVEPVAVGEVSKLSVLGGAVTGKLTASGTMRLTARAVGTLGSFRLEARCDARRASLAYGDVFRKPAGVPLWFGVEGKAVDGVVDLAEIAIGLAGLKIAGKGKVSPGPPLAVDLECESNQVPLQGWEELLLPLAKRAVSGEVRIEARLKGKVGAGRLPAVEGTLALEDFGARLERPPVKLAGLSTRIQIKGDSLVVPPSTLRLDGFPVQVGAHASGLPLPRVVFSLAAAEIEAASLGFASGSVRRREVLRDLRVEGRAELAAVPLRAQAQVRSTRGTVRDMDYRNLAVDLGVGGRVLSVRDASLEAFAGRWTGSGRYNPDAPGGGEFLLRSSVENVSVAAVLASRASPLAGHVDGRLSGNVQLTASGSEWRALEKTLRGDGRVQVKDGMLRDVNIAESVFSAVTGIPGLSKLISERTRQRHPGLFGATGTRFLRMTATVRIAEGRVATDDLVLAARDYSLRGKGSVDFGGRTDLSVRLVASPELTADLERSLRETRYLANSKGRFAIPFRLAGTLPGLRPKVDRAFILKALARASLQTGLGKLLGGGSKPGAGKRGKKKAQKGKEGEPRSPREILEKRLEGLLGR